MGEVLHCACGRRYGMPLAEGKKRCECGTPFAYGRVFDQPGFPQQSKSILDGMQVKETPEYKSVMAALQPDVDPGDCCQEKQCFGIVGQCPACGAPIYGPKETDEEEPLVRFSCQCRRRTQA